jgi:hypothetical protein
MEHYSTEYPKLLNLELLFKKPYPNVWRQWKADEPFDIFMADLASQRFDPQSFIKNEDNLRQILLYL